MSFQDRARKARESGDSHFMPDRPCKRGHLELRRATEKPNCPACDREMWSKTEASLASGRRTKVKRAARRTPEEHAAYLAYQRQWKKDNAKRMYVHKVAYRSAKDNRTPAWADMEAIQKIYADCPKGDHVDHVIPLRGKKVSGLHVEYNLQYMDAQCNRKKNASFEPHFFSNEHITKTKELLNV